MASTAQRLIAYRRELREAAFDNDLVNDMVKDAAQTLVMNEGLLVAARENKGKDDFVDQHANPSLGGTTPTP
ncbi:hypothetical protein [Streptomyces nodosus]|uniref:hypothetical protein n=1 Tax=Streptomyces nodosus TaxID=40318 RepID=UPI0037F1AE0E